MEVCATARKTGRIASVQLDTTETTASTNVCVNIVCSNLQWTNYNNDGVLHTKEIRLLTQYLTTSFVSFSVVVGQTCSALDSAGCLNGGQCIFTEDGPVCLCPSNWGGNYCEIGSKYTQESPH